jgi:hypothetical protein
VATNVANQSSSSSTGSKIQVFLLLVHRHPAAHLPVAARAAGHPHPGGVRAADLDALHREPGRARAQDSEITELLPIVLLLGAGTDYGLFLVLRVREEIGGGREPRDAVAHALVRVGESISASAGTVILALVTLPAAKADRPGDAAMGSASPGAPP